MKGKYHQSQFPNDDHKWSEEPLDLVYSDVCGKLNK